MNGLQRINAGTILLPEQRPLLLRVTGMSGRPHAEAHANVAGPAAPHMMYFIYSLVLALTLLAGSP